MSSTCLIQKIKKFEHFMRINKVEEIRMDLLKSLVRT